MTYELEAIRERHKNVEPPEGFLVSLRDGQQAHADRATLLRALDEAQEELSIWQSVFPDIAPANVLPDRSKLEAELLAMAKENAMLKAMICTIIENEPYDAVSDGGHTVLDLWRHDARAALKETGQ